MSISKTLSFTVADGEEIAASSFGDDSDPPVLLLHGAGQTRHSWQQTAISLANNGFRAISIDTRGHGDSNWSADGDYSIEKLIKDLCFIVDCVQQKGGPRPAVVGASLGGITALLAQGESMQPVFSAMVLVDITPRIDPDGVARILQFMSRFNDGFESIEQAAAAVVAYQPGRAQTRHSSRDRKSGLLKNLRLRDDGRYYWHWDPRLLDHVSHFGEAFVERQKRAAATMQLPVLLVHGKLSEIVSDDAAQEFLALVPQARYIDVADAAHMVASDDNNVFAGAVGDFLVECLL